MPKPAEDPQVMAVVDRFNGNAAAIEATLGAVRRVEAQLAIAECALACARLYGLNAIQLEDAIAKAVIKEKRRQLGLPQMVWR